MSDSDPRQDRLLRLNAALDDELDATHRLELERELARDPQLRASLRRLSAVREAVRRHGAPETAPAALRDAVAAIGRPQANWRRIPLSLAAAVAAGIVIGAAAQALLASSRTADPVAAAMVADFARGRAFRPAVRRRLLGPPYGQAMARRPRAARRRSRRPCRQGLSAGGRAHRRRRRDAGPDTGLPAARALDRSDGVAALARRRRGRGAGRNARRIPPCSLGRPGASLCRRVGHRRRRIGGLRRRLPLRGRGRRRRGAMKSPRRPSLALIGRLYSARRRKAAMAINGRRNKSFGPGGGTRRLHPSPPDTAGFGGGEIGSTGDLKDALSLGMIPPLSGQTYSCE